MQKNMNVRVWALLVIAVAFVALLFGVWLRHNTAPKTEALKTLSATILPTPRQIEPFQLTGADGKPFTNANFKGHWTMLFFGFTRCPDLCPTTLSLMNQAYQQMEKDHLQPMPQVVFISVDPDFDAAKDRIKNYLLSFNSHFIGATGPQAAIDQLTQNLSVVYMKVMDENNQAEENYRIDHSGTILVLDPQGHWYALFSTPHQPGNLAKDMEMMIKQHS